MTLEQRKEALIEMVLKMTPEQVRQVLELLEQDAEEHKE